MTPIDPLSSPSHSFEYIVLNLYGNIFGIQTIHTFLSSESPNMVIGGVQNNKSWFTETILKRRVKASGLVDRCIAYEMRDTCVKCVCTFYYIFSVLLCSIAFRAVVVYALMWGALTAHSATESEHWTVSYTRHALLPVVVGATAITYYCNAMTSLLLSLLLSALLCVVVAVIYRRRGRNTLWGGTRKKRR